MRIFSKIRKKLNSHQGMTLMELMCCMVILALVSGGLVTVSMIAAEQYEKSVRSSEARVVCSTLQTLMTSELSYTHEVVVNADGDVLAYQSSSYAIHGALSSVMSDQLGENGTYTYGTFLLGNAEEPSEYKSPLGASVYEDGLGILVEEFTYEEASSTFRMTIQAGYQGQEITSVSFQVIAVNPVKVVVK